MNSSLAILGDLHYELEDDLLYRNSIAQIKAHGPQTVVSLGDIGGYSHAGTRQSFDEGYHLLNQFGVPFYALLGNHDMEAPEFKTDQAVIDAWNYVFDQPKSYFCVDLGEALGICLSNSRFRDAPFFKHEVAIDDEQYAWFEKTLAENRHRPTFVFSHTPIWKTGLRVIQSIHLAANSAYLNHCDRPERFIELVKDNPQVKLWFSGHIHLGQYYDDAITTSGHCAFVHVGTMARVSRDGHLHSRFLTFNQDGYELFTVDHISNQYHLALRSNYQNNTPEVLPLPKNIISSTAKNDSFPAPPAFDDITPLFDINNSRFAIAHNALVEYNITHRAAQSVVIKNMTDKTVTAQGENIHVLHKPKSKTAESNTPEPPPSLTAQESPPETETIIKPCPIRKGYYLESNANC